jgi:hypothetical protein
VVLTTGYRPGSIHRKADFAELNDDNTLTLHEVKTGVPTWRSQLDECEKDAWILSPEGKAVHGQDITAVHWHFFPHGGFNSLGPADFVLDCLIRNNIPFTIHAPNI